MIPMSGESQEIKQLFKKLCSQPRQLFPQHRQPLNASSKPGVYLIRKGEIVLHVGMTIRGKGGLHQRLKNHLHGLSSFTVKHLKGDGTVLRNGYTFQYLELKSLRKRALLEAYAIGTLCPKHLLGLRKDKFAQVIDAHVGA